MNFTRTAAKSLTIYKKGTNRFKGIPKGSHVPNMGDFFFLLAQLIFKEKTIMFFTENNNQTRICKDKLGQLLYSKEDKKRKTVSVLKWAPLDS